MAKKKIYATPHEEDEVVVNPGEQDRKFSIRPVWEKNAQFQIDGQEMEILLNFFEQIKTPFNVINKVFAKGFIDGVVRNQGFYEDGSPVDEELQDKIDGESQMNREMLREKISA